MSDNTPTPNAPPPPGGAGSPPPGTPPPSGAGTPPPATTPPAAPPPAPIELKLPDGVAPESVAEFKKMAAELGLKSEQAQALYDADLEKGQAMQAEGVKALEALQAGWLEQVKVDKEIGGANLDASKAAVKKALAKFGTPELAGFLETQGLRPGDHPELVRFFVRVGKALGEDGTGGGGTPPPPPVDPLRLMYPTMFPKE